MQRGVRCQADMELCGAMVHSDHPALVVFTDGVDQVGIGGRKKELRPQACVKEGSGTQENFGDAACCVDVGRCQGQQGSRQYKYI